METREVFDNGRGIWRFALIVAAMAMTAAAITAAALSMNRLVADLQTAAEHQSRLSHVQQRVMALSYRMTDATERAVRGDKAAIERHDRLNTQLDNALTDLVTLSADNLGDGTLAEDREAYLAIEDVAVAFAKRGDLQRAQNMLDDEYRTLKLAYIGQLEATLDEAAELMESELERAQDMAYAMTGIGALVMLVIIGLWIGVAYDSHTQNRKLSIARQALQTHNSRLERAVEKRTRDLAQAKEKAEAANRAKSDFLATMSHEIRTPLNGVLGMTGALKRTEMSDAQMGMLDVVEESGRTLLALLNDVLDLSRIEAGQVELEETVFSVEALAAHSATLFQPMAEEKGLTLEVSVDESAQGYWLGDTLRLRQILHNLLSNAMKFTAEGGVSGRVYEDDGALVIAVSDTGIGISEDRLKAIFDRFTQADNSTTRKFGGSGLGLTITRKLAQIMGGDIEVESVEGEGSTFRARLTLKRPTRQQVAEMSEADEAA